MTIFANLNAWQTGFLIVLALFLLGSAIFAAWDEWTCDRNRKRQARANVVGLTRAEQIADFPEAVERDLRRSS